MERTEVVVASRWNSAEVNYGLASRTKMHLDVELGLLAEAVFSSDIAGLDSRRVPGRMGIGWKVWFGVLGLASLYGFILISEAAERASVRETLASGAPQQTVVGLWHLQDLMAALIFVLTVLVIAVASIGFVMAARPAQSASTLPSGTETSTPPDTSARL